MVYLNKKILIFYPMNIINLLKNMIKKQENKKVYEEIKRITSDWINFSLNDAIKAKNKSFFSFKWKDGTKNFEVSYWKLPDEFISRRHILKPYKNKKVYYYIRNERDKTFTFDKFEINNLVIRWTKNKLLFEILKDLKNNWFNSIRKEPMNIILNEEDLQFDTEISKEMVNIAAYKSNIAKEMSDIYFSQDLFLSLEEREKAIKKLSKKIED